MYSQRIPRTDSTDSTSKKTNRALYILGFIEFIFISICLLLLFLNQNLNKVVDDYSPAYKTPNDDDDDYIPQTSTAISTKNSPSTTSDNSVPDVMTKLTTKAYRAIYPEKQQMVKILFPTKKPVILDHSKNEMNLKSQQEGEWTEVFVSNLIPGRALFRLKRKESLAKDNKARGSTQSNLHHLLIMYPCCVSAMILLWMQMISRLTNDNMFKSTMIAFIVICIAIGATIFVISVIESVNQKNSIGILIAVSSAIFIILEVIDFALLFVVV